MKSYFASSGTEAVSIFEPQYGIDVNSLVTSLHSNSHNDYQVSSVISSTPKPPRKKCRTRGGYNSSTVTNTSMLENLVSPINIDTDEPSMYSDSSFSQPALSMLALTALSLPSLSQNEQTDSLLLPPLKNVEHVPDIDFNINSINNITRPNTNTAPQIHQNKFNKNNSICVNKFYNVSAGTKPSTSVAVVNVSQQSSMQTFSSVEAPLFHHCIDTANNINNNYHDPRPNTCTTLQVPQINNNANIMSPNFAGTQLFPSTPVAAVNTSLLMSQQSSSLRTIPTVEAQLFPRVFQECN